MIFLIIYIPDDDALVFAINEHVAIHIISECVDMRRVLVSCLSSAIAK